MSTDTGYPVGREQRYYAREFLNRPGHHALAAVQAEVTYEPPTETYDGVVEGHLQIADCNRTVKLVFTLHNDERAANDLHKIATLYEVIGEFFGQLNLTYDRLLYDRDRKAVRA